MHGHSLHIFKAILLLFLLPSIIACAHQNDVKKYTIAPDKIKHFSVSLGISAASAAHYKHKNDADACKSAAIGFGLSMSVGIGKETYDKFIKKTFWDWGDMAANLVGSTLGSLLGSGCP
ncbi:MAG: hypothetical protein ACC707_10730 [Thiohalomonadales bacterium]